MFCGPYFERMHIIRLIELIWILFEKFFFVFTNYFDPNKILWKNEIRAAQFCEKNDGTIISYIIQISKQNIK